MPPILIVKLGSTIPALAEMHGDFEDWIAARLGVGPGQVAVVNPQVASLPEPWRYAGVILTGSHAMVTDHAEWSERTASWIPAVIGAGTPLLGICYGHQLIAYALGGDVGPNPRGRESGTVAITLQDAARTDPLFTGLPATFLAQASHAQSVLPLPPGATCLASSRLDRHHAYAVGRLAWGVQFHPELNVATMRAYIDRCTDELRAQGDDPVRLLEVAAETPHAEDVLRRFARIAVGTGPPTGSPGP